MRRERVADDIYVFISERYAQVTMGAIITPDGIILIDTFPFPSETREALEFLRARAPYDIRYVINTHHHADHTYGNYLMEGADIIAHERCREALRRLGDQGLARAKAENPELAEVKIRLPDITFVSELYLHLGERTLHLMYAPGHTDDSIVVMVEGDKILFTGDLVMPVPYIVWGDWQQFRDSLEFVQALKPENIVQGHGDILLRGELRQDLDESIAYLDNIRTWAQQIVDRNGPPSELAKYDIETAGKSRIPLDGLVKQLHLANMTYLYRKFQAQKNQQH